MLVILFLVEWLCCLDVYKHVSQTYEGIAGGVRQVELMWWAGGVRVGFT